MLNPVGFWSYARHDDEHTDGRLTQLRAIVGKQIGEPIGFERWRMRPDMFKMRELLSRPPFQR